MQGYCNNEKIIDHTISGSANLKNDRSIRLKAFSIVHQLQLLVGLLQYDLFLVFPDIRPEINGNSYQKQYYTKINNLKAEQPLAPVRLLK